jgi:hypothetical protein
VFDYFSDIKQNSVDDLRNVDWLFGPRSMFKWPNLRKDSGWKSLGILSGPADDFVPDFKAVPEQVPKSNVAAHILGASKLEKWLL